MYFIFKPVLLLFLFAFSSQAAEPREREWVSAPWDNLFAVVTEGGGEPRSIGSYSVRIYRNNRDYFIDGKIGTRNGGIANLWFDDLDQDHNPEVCIWVNNAGSGSYGELHVYTLVNAHLERIPLFEPELEQISGYRGHDEYGLQDGHIYRTFPLYLPTDTMTEPTGGMTRLTLDFDNRRWVEKGK